MNQWRAVMLANSGYTLFLQLRIWLQIMLRCCSLIMIHMKVSIRVIKSRRLRWAGHVACMGEMWGAHSALMGKPEGRRPLGRRRRRWEDNIKMDLREVGWRARTGLIWLRTGTGGKLLWIRLWTFGFHKMWRISWVALNVLASQEGLCSMQLFW
jgi:hypothetical protein